MHDMIAMAALMDMVGKHRGRTWTEEEFYEEFGNPTLFQQLLARFRDFAKPAACTTEKTCGCPGEGKHRPVDPAAQTASRHY